jgi:cysteinyl-tRNA synthetase
MHSLVSSFYSTFDPDRRAHLKTELKANGNLLGLLEMAPLAALKGDYSNMGKYVDEQVAERTLARRERRFADADRIRTLLAEDGIILEDKPDGTTEWRLG